MNTFLLEQTEDSPLVRLDPDKGHILLKGRSYMEDSHVFLNAILGWLRSYMTNPQPYNIVELEFEYLNASSHGMLIYLLEEINKYYIMGYEFDVLWKFHNDDESLADIGQELNEMFDVPIKQLILV